MKKSALYFGFFTGIIYAYASVIHIIGIIDCTTDAFSIIRQADFSVFTVKTYVDIYSPYILQLTFCLSLVSFLCFHFIALFKSKYSIRKISFISLIWCIVNAILIFSPITINIYSQTPAIPYSESEFRITHIENVFPFEYHPYEWIFVASLLCIVFSVLCLSRNQKLQIE